MNEVLKSLLEFVVLFIVVFIVYKLIYRKKKDFNKLKNTDEVRSFILKYDLDIRQINYKKLLNVLILINTFIISFTATIIVRIKSFGWSIAVCILIVTALILSLFPIAGNYFKSHEREIVVEKEIDTFVKENKKKKKTKKKEGNKNV